MYKSYICDSLQIIGKNTAKFGGGGYIKKRYIDVIKEFDKRAYKKEETKSAEDIIFSTIAKAGLKIKGVKK